MRTSTACAARPRAVPSSCPPPRRPRPGRTRASCSSAPRERWASSPRRPCGSVACRRPFGPTPGSSPTSPRAPRHCGRWSSRDCSWPSRACPMSTRPPSGSPSSAANCSARAFWPTCAPAGSRPHVCSSSATTEAQPRCVRVAPRAVRSCAGTRASTSAPFRRRRGRSTASRLRTCAISCCVRE